MHESWCRRPFVAALMLTSSLVLPSTLAAADDKPAEGGASKSGDAQAPESDAQQSQQPGTDTTQRPSSGAPSNVEKVTVTATRRAQPVHKVPYNISAYGGDKLNKQGVNNLGDLAQIVPGLSYVDSGPRASGNNNGFILRGLNANPAAAFDTSNTATPTVSTYLGETPVFFNLKLTDLQRVEVLRGPQGTLYGSGSLGGTIRFIPNDPDPEAFEARVRVGGAWTDNSDEASYEFDGMLNIPLSDKAALRISGGHEKLGGFIDANGLVVLGPGGVPVLDGPILDPATNIVRRREKDVNDADVRYVRAALALELADNVDVHVAYNYQENGADARQAHNPLFPGNGKYEQSASFLEPFDSRVHLASFDVAVDFGFASLTSASSYYDINVRADADNSGFYQENLAQFYFFYPRFADRGEYTNAENAFVQELRLVSTEGGKFDWIAGAFYLKQNKTFHNTDRPDPGLAAYASALDPYMTYYGIPTPDLSNVNLFETTLDTEFQDIALFGELTWHLTEHWQITGGARAFWQEFSANVETAVPACFALLNPLGAGASCGDPPNGVARVNANTTIEDHVLKLNTSYDIAPDNLLYFTWAQGFRHGGVNGLPTNGLFASPVSELVYKADTVDNFELGIKGQLLDGTLGYTVAGFYIDWKDIQFDGFTDVGFNAVFNGGAASSRGLELELAFSPTGYFDAAFGYTYTNAHLDQDFATGGTTGFKGDRLIGAPEHTANLALNYRAPLDGGMTLLLGMNGSYQSETRPSFNPTNRNFFVMDGFAVLNLSAGLETDVGTFQLYADNVFSEEGTTGGTVTFGPRHQYFQVIRPLTIGLTFTRSFGATN